jgi:hypothetical protein
MARFTTNQRKALWALLITTLGGIIVAAINIAPALRSGSPTPAPSPVAKNLSATGNNNAVINAEGSSVTVTTGDNGRIADALERGLPRATNVEIANITLDEKCFWGPLAKDGSRRYDMTTRGELANFFKASDPDAPRYPLYTYQPTVYGLNEKMKKKVDRECTLDPLFDISLVNNSSKTILITECSFVIDQAWSEPKAMPTGGRLQVFDTIIIDIGEVEPGRQFTAILADPIYLTPTAPYRCKIWLRNLCKGMGGSPKAGEIRVRYNELLARIHFKTSEGDVETKQINFSFL